MKGILWVVIIVGSIISIILSQALDIKVDSIHESISLTEANVFDPLCKDKQIFSIDYSVICKPHTQWSSSLGSSSNIDDNYGGNYDRHLITFLLKIPLNKLPSNNLIQEIRIDTAEIRLRTGTDIYNKNETDTEFAVLTSFCQNSTWSNLTPMLDLPCINADKGINYTITDVSTYKKTSELAVTTIDIRDHMKLALDNKLNSFTELIQFYPKQFRKLDFSDQQRLCLYNHVNYLNDMLECVGENRIGVYSVEHPAEGLRPHIFLSYTTQLSLIGKIIVAAISTIPTISSIIVAYLLDKKSSKDNSRLEKKISKQNKTVLETKEILQKTLQDHDERYRQRVLSLKVYLASMFRAVNDLILQGESSVKITQHMQEELDWINSERNDLEFSVKELSKGILPSQMISKGSKICDQAKKLTIVQNDNVVLNLDSCIILKNQINDLLKIISNQPS